MNETSSTPRWETAVMAGSFLLIWAYFLARQGSAGMPLHFAWNGALALAVVALIAIFVRRLKRTLALLKNSDSARRR